MTLPPLPAAPAAPPRAAPPATPGRRASGVPRALRPALALALLLSVLAACGGPPPPVGELREILDEQHRIADPGIIGASATGRACAISRTEALTKAQRVAHFNLRSLTGSARYKVRFDLLDQTEAPEGFCVELSATALEPRPFLR